MKIREALIEFTQPEVPFKKENIAYVKEKYHQYKNGRKKNQKNGHLGFFMNPNNTFHPEGFLYKTIQANKEAGFDGIDLNNPENNSDIQYSQEELEQMEIHRWAYDIYSYSQILKTSFDQLAENYELLIVLYLIFLDPQYFNKSNICVLYKNLESKKVESTLDILEMKYTAILQLGNWDLRMMGFRNSEEGLIKSSPEKQKTGKKSVKVFEVHKKIKRVGGKINPNSLTLLDTKGSAFLFRFLAEAKAIIKDNGLLSQRDLSKHLACMTGYNESNLLESLSPKMVMDLESLEEILKVSDRLNMLIKSEIENVKRRTPKKV